jgi:hypothetical protein
MGLARSPLEQFTIELPRGWIGRPSEVGIHSPGYANNHGGRAIVNAGMGMTLRQAALVAAFTSFAPLLLGGVPFAEFYVFAKLIVPGDTAETVRNILANRRLFLAGVFAHLLTFVADVILAWALYVLLAPVHRALSLLTA